MAKLGLESRAPQQFEKGDALAFQTSAYDCQAHKMSHLIAMTVIKGWTSIGVAEPLGWDARGRGVATPMAHGQQGLVSEQQALTPGHFP